MQSYELQTSRPQSLLLSRPNQRYFISGQTGFAFTFVWAIEDKFCTYLLVSRSLGLDEGILFLGLITLHARSISEIRLSNDILPPPLTCEKEQTSVKGTEAYSFAACKVLISNGIFMYACLNYLTYWYFICKFYSTVIEFWSLYVDIENCLTNTI